MATDCEANRLILSEQSAVLTALTPEAYAAGIIALCQDEARRKRLAAGGGELIRTTHNFEAFREALRLCYRYALK